MKASSSIRSNCEKDFILSSLQNRIRFDGRDFYEYRKVKISFGESFGHCDVCIGNTRVLAQVSCEVVKPNKTRPNEGQLFLNVELSPMASPAFETGRPSDYAVEINRFIERCLKESRPVDMESLCIIAEEKVWCLRVDVQVLDDTGNILDCACIAAISALANFRRPDVTVHGKDIVIGLRASKRKPVLSHVQLLQKRGTILHSPDDKEPIPLSVHHKPICVSLGFVNACEKPIVDPSELEECILDGQMIVALNSHMEICCAKMCGVSVDPDQIIMCCKIASSKVGEITENIERSLAKENKRRFPKKDLTKKWRVGDDTDIMKTVAEPTKIDITETVRDATETSNNIQTNFEDTPVVEMKARGIATIGDGNSSAWIISDDESDEQDETNVPTKNNNTKGINKTGKPIQKEVECIMLDDDSEEDETMQLTHEDLGYKNSKLVEDNMDSDVEILDSGIENLDPDLKNFDMEEKITDTDMGEPDIDLKEPDLDLKDPDLKGKNPDLDLENRDADIEIVELHESVKLLDAKKGNVEENTIQKKKKRKKKKNKPVE